MDLISLIESLEGMDLNRTLVDCKKYDKATISYISNGGFSVLINGNEKYSNVRQIIIYIEGVTVNLIIQSLGLINSKLDVGNVESIIKME